MTCEDLLPIYNCPTKPVDIILDTDTYNEIDDQYAIAYTLANCDKINVLGFTIAPFRKACCVKDIPESQIKSREEIIRVLTYCKRTDYIDKIYIGSDRFLADKNTPVMSPAAEFIVEASKGYNKDKPLYICAIGAITNVASAILIDPDIVNRVCVVWLGGTALDYYKNKEYNMHQDVIAARVVIGSAVPFVQLPTFGVVSEFTTTEYELEHWLKGKNPICDYLYNSTLAFAEKRSKTGAWSKVIWDVVSPAWLLNENDRFMQGRIECRYLPTLKGYRYTKSKNRNKMFYVHKINRDALMSDMFYKLANFKGFNK